MAKLNSCITVGSSNNPISQRKIKANDKNSGMEKQPQPRKHTIVLRNFFSYIKNRLSESLSNIIEDRNYKIYQKSNALKIRLQGFPGSFYEIAIKRDYDRPRYFIEIGIQFVGNQDFCDKSIGFFKSYLDEHKQYFGLPRESEELMKCEGEKVKLRFPWIGDLFSESLNWDTFTLSTETRTYIFNKSNYFEEYFALILEYIKLTYPILNTLYKNIDQNRKTKININKRNKSDILYANFDREINCIQMYIMGQYKTQPDDEKLCDWVNFCYITGLYSEGRDLFVLIDPNEVNSWYYERTKKLARLCAIRAM